MKKIRLVQTTFYDFPLTASEVPTLPILLDEYWFYGLQ